MQVVLQGSLRHFAVVELLSFLCGRGESGTMDFEAGDRRVRVLFVGDLIVRVESDRDGDPKEAVLELFDWHAGTFTVVDSVVVPDNVVPLGLELPALLEEVKRRAEAAGLYPDAELFRVVDDPSLQQQVSLTGDQFRLLFRLSAGRTFKEIVGDLGAPKKEVADRLRQLIEIGLATRVVPEPVTPEEKTEPQIKRRTTSGRRRTLVGSLTPDGAPDNVYPLLDSEYTVGRASANGISITDGSVSAQHARILRTPEGFVLQDLQRVPKWVPHLHLALRRYECYRRCLGPLRAGG